MEGKNQFQGISAVSEILERIPGKLYISVCWTFQTNILYFRFIFWKHCAASAKLNTKIQGDPVELKISMILLLGLGGSFGAKIYGKIALMIGHLEYKFSKFQKITD